MVFGRVERAIAFSLVSGVVAAPAGTADKTAMGLLEQLPPEKNTITEGWEELGLKADNAARSQALIELKNLYCGQRRCLHCVIGADLLKRTLP